MSQRTIERNPGTPEQEPRITVPHIAFVGYVKDLNALNLQPHKTMQIFSAFAKMRKLHDTTTITLHFPESMNEEDYLSAESMLFDARPAILFHRMNLVWQGDRSSLPDRLTDTLDNYLTLPPDIPPLQTIALSIGYGGRQEIVDATKKILQLGDTTFAISPFTKEDEKNEATAFRKYLALGNLPDMDLVILTGEDTTRNNSHHGIFSLANLGFTAAYTEYLPTHKPFSELSFDDLKHFIDAFAKRERPQGGERKESINP